MKTTTSILFAASLALVASSAQAEDPPAASVQLASAATQAAGQSVIEVAPNAAQHALEFEVPAEKPLYRRPALWGGLSAALGAVGGALLIGAYVEGQEGIHMASMHDPNGISKARQADQLQYAGYGTVITAGVLAVTSIALAIHYRLHPTYTNRLSAARRSR